MKPVLGTCDVTRRTLVRLDSSVGTVTLKSHEHSHTHPDHYPR